MLCSTSSTPTPHSRTTAVRISPNRFVSSMSRPDDGSSSRSRSNPPASTRASSTSLFWPVGKRPACLFAKMADPDEVQRLVDRCRR